MVIDIIEITEPEMNRLTADKRKLIRTAQKKKNVLIYKAERQLENYRIKLLTAGMKYSSLYDSKKAELDAEVYRQIEILADDLNFELNKDKFMSGGTGIDGDYGYLVDYSLSYEERYNIVRAYYLAIADVDERKRRYNADDVAKAYLGTYYGILYNVIATR